MRIPNRRRKLFNEQHGKCFYCGVQMLQSEPEAYQRTCCDPRLCTVDHKTALARGGPRSKVSNTVAACYQCNNSKRACGFDEWMRWVDHFGIDFAREYAISTYSMEGERKFDEQGFISKAWTRMFKPEKINDHLHKETVYFPSET